MALDPEIVATLSRVTTATLTTVLLKKGLRNVWLRGTRPLNPDQPRLVGPALRSRASPSSTGGNRSPAAASRCFPMTSSSPTTTAPC
jgi:hypothetical protein